MTIPVRCPRCDTIIGRRERYSYGGPANDDHTDYGAVVPLERYGGERDGDYYCKDCYRDYYCKDCYDDGALKITVSRPINGISINRDEYLLDDDGKELSFASVREAVNFLADHNFTIGDLRELDFNLEAGSAGGRGM
jgi:hypothetical protein